MSEKDGIRLAIECVNRHNHGFIGCHPMFVRGHNEAVKAITKELSSIIETASLGGDYFEGFSEGVKVGQQEADSALREENARLREALKPFGQIFLYPDDLGFEASEDIRADVDWDEDANEMQTENVFVLRRDIRAARAAIREGGKE